MSRTSETKNKIIDILKKENKRLKDIAPALGLSDSTVSQHLIELKKMNVIEEVEDNHFRNMKYYRLKNWGRPSFNENKESIVSSNNAFILRAITIFAFALGLIFLLISLNPATGRNNNINLNLLLTDPPLVPSGTQALYINYTNLEVQFMNSSTWTKFNSSGTLDLLKLKNFTAVIGTIKVPADSSPYKIKFDISKARIIISGIPYNVSLLNETVSMQIYNAGRITKAGSVILIDLSPIITTIYTNSSATFTFSAYYRAGQAGALNGTVIIGTINKLTSSELNALGPETFSILIDNTSLSSIHGTNTRFSMRIQNTGNSSVTVKQIIISGAEKIQYNSNVSLKRQIPNLNTINLLINQNGTLVLPYSRNNITGAGYTLAPGERMDLRFNNTISLANDSVTALVPSSSYNVTITGDDGMRSKQNLIASGS